MNVPVDPRAPLLLFGLWFPLGTLAGFGLLAAADLVLFPNAVLAVTLLAAIGWVAVGFGGGRVEGPLGTSSGSTTEVDSSPGGVLVYLSATTALGWAVVLLVFL